MCTALSIKTKEGSNFFGRNMDLPYFFNQSVLVIPRKYEYKNLVTKDIEKGKHAVIGMGTIIDNHLALADAMNEKGLACAGLNFLDYAYFGDNIINDKVNIAPYDFIYWVVTNFENIDEVKEALKNINFVNVPINDKTPVSMLHWMVCDKSGKSIVVENTKDGLFVYDNPVDVMTNNPRVDWHLTNLNEYINITPVQPKDTKWSDKKIRALGGGAGTRGIPGDFASVSRFVRIAYIRSVMPSIEDDLTAITQFFHMLDYVKMVRGGVITEDGFEDMTTYSSCMNQEKGIYYYKNYENNRINAVDINKENLDGSEIKSFKYVREQDINYIN